MVGAATGMRQAHSLGACESGEEGTELLKTVGGSNRAEAQLTQR